MNSKTIFTLTLMTVCLAACGKSAAIFTPDSRLATSTLDVTAEEVEVQTSTGVFKAQTAGDWILYWKNENVATTVITAFTFDQKGSVWIGSDNTPRRVVYLDLNSGSYTDYVLDQVFSITNIEIGENGELWVGSSTYRFKDGKWTYFGIYSLFPQISPDHSIWAHSLNSLDTNLTACPARYDQDKWTRFCPPFGDDTIRMGHFRIDDVGNIWVFTHSKDLYNQGVWELSSAGWQSVKELGNDKEPLYTMAQGPARDLWFISSKHNTSQEIGRIKRFDGKEWLLDIENPADTSDMFVYDIHVDKNNMLWAQGIYTTDKTGDYIFRLNDNNQWEEVVSAPELAGLWGLHFLQIYTFEFSPSGNLCLATSIGFMCKTK